MAANSTFKLFSTSGGIGLDFSDPSSEAPLPPPPPPTEVLSSEVSSTLKFSVEPVTLDGLTLFKGRVSTKEVFGLPNSDLVPGVYEGGLKLWEGSVDLVKALRSEVQCGHLSFNGKRVLELGCGHGLPGISACLEIPEGPASGDPAHSIKIKLCCFLHQGARVVHFQDFNAEVLRSLTIPNVNVNLAKESLSGRSDESNCGSGAELRFFAGDWSQIDQCLPYICNKENDLDCCSEQPVSGYDVILMAETIYSISAQQNLYGLIKKCLRRPHGVVYFAAKKYYFGVGGGTRQFLSMVEKDGIMAGSLVAEVADGSSNVREVWKLSMK